MSLQLTVGKGPLPGRGLGRCLQGEAEAPMLKDKRDRYDLGFKPDARQRKKEIEKKQERRRARLNGGEVEWELITFPHISKTFILGGTIQPDRKTPRKETAKEMLRNLSINAISEEGIGEENLSNIRPYVPRSILNNWTAEEILVESPFKQDLCTEDSQDLEDVRDCRLSPNLLRMVKHDEKQILPHKESSVNCEPGRGKREWVANIVPVPKKDGKVPMCVDYRDLNKARPKDNFPLPHIDSLVDNTAGYSLFSFMDGFSEYNQIKMHPEDMEKTTFVTLWGTFCYKVMPFGLKNAGATYQRAMVTLFHDMMHQEIEVYVDDMILKSRTEKEHIEVLRKLFLRLLILYLAVFGNSMGCVLGQHDESGRKERTIYYLRKKFTECETRYLSIEKLCCALIWTTRRLRQYHTTWLISKLDPLKYMMVSTALNGRMVRWQILLSEFDIAYVNQMAVKGSSIADFLASRALEDYEPLNFDFPNEDLLYIATTEDDSQESHSWKLNFDGASNTVGNGIGVVLVSPNGDHYPFTSKLDFDCTNNIAEYETCIMGIRAAIEHEIKVLEVYGDFALDFDNITFYYLPRDENQMADALATLASMVRVNKQEDVQHIQMSIYETPAHCYNIEEEEEKDDHPWYNDILRYMKNHEYPEQATENDKRTLRKLANDYVLDGEIIYKRRKDQVLLRCVDAVEAKQILEEVH
ncbi:reverse transcriptase [Gossypium australe]|uniref:Reverse transcriptase n=1 Tax=Gossypium australe TaxID=47621 RepID=A0A5B6WUK3_9ROSI|nr:reverse transcriptase [Gossypium australe]